TVLRDGEELNVSITTEKGYIGIVGVKNVYKGALPLWYYVLSFLISLFSWVAFLNFMIGLVNMLPLPPLDGGYIYMDLLEKMGLQPAYRFILWLTITVLIINVLPWFV
ncbi:TPA: RIP metalloprotease, partial [Candidatus Micrarchaeota archaeon]|nr:RIP metalloprotease [Candidatus Micrarchaeota archaeon]